MSFKMTSFPIVCGALGLSGLLFASACVSKTDPPPVTDPYPTQTSFCEALATAACNDSVVTKCYGSAADDLPTDRSNCIDSFSNPANCNAASLPYDSAGAQACIDSYAAAYADAALTRDELEAAAETCLAVFSKGGGVGSTCTADSDCDGGAGLRCVTKAAEGTCQIPTTVGPGLDCAGADAECEDMFYCGQDDACVQRPDVSEDCSETKPCNVDAQCIDLVCVAKKANGQPCGTDDECSGGFCDTPTGQTMGSCVATLSLGATSASCDVFK